MNKEINFTAFSKNWKQKNLTYYQILSTDEFTSDKVLLKALTNKLQVIQSEYKSDCLIMTQKVNICLDAYNVLADPVEREKYNNNLQGRLLHSFEQLETFCLYHDRIVKKNYSISDYQDILKKAHTMEEAILLLDKESQSSDLMIKLRKEISDCKNISDKINYLECLIDYLKYRKVMVPTNLKEVFVKKI